MHIACSSTWCQCPSWANIYLNNSIISELLVTNINLCGFFFTSSFILALTHFSRPLSLYLLRLCPTHTFCFIHFLSSSFAHFNCVNHKIMSCNVQNLLHYPVDSDLIALFNKDSYLPKAYIIFETHQISITFCVLHVFFSLFSLTLRFHLPYQPNINGFCIKHSFD